jgi:hypothetical protein
MLTALLPGFRGIRSALVAGYLWFSAAWLLFADLVDKQPILSSNAAALVNFFGFGGKIVAVSVLCLLVGEAASAPVHSIFFRLSQASLLRLEPATVGTPPTGWRRLFFPMSSRSVKRVYARAMSGQKGDGSSQSEMEQRAMESIHEVLYLSPRLIVVKPELYVEYDRLRSESEFRDALLLPLLLFSVAVCSNTAMASWIEAIIIALVVLIDCYFFLQSRQQFRTAFSMVAHRVADGTIDLSSTADEPTRTPEQLP